VIGHGFICLAGPARGPLVVPRQAALESEWVVEGAIATVLLYHTSPPNYIGGYERLHEIRFDLTVIFPIYEALFVGLLDQVSYGLS